MVVIRESCTIKIQGGKGIVTGIAAHRFVHGNTKTDNSMFGLLQLECCRDGRGEAQEKTGQEQCELPNLLIHGCPPRRTTLRMRSKQEKGYNLVEDNGNKVNSYFTHTYLADTLASQIPNPPHVNLNSEPSGMPHGVSTFLGLELELKHSGGGHSRVDSRNPSVHPDFYYLVLERLALQWNSPRGTCMRALLSVREFRRLKVV